jgi:hypothetical protein
LTVLVRRVGFDGALFAGVDRARVNASARVSSAVRAPAQALMALSSQRQLPTLKLPSSFSPADVQLRNPSGA